MKWITFVLVLGLSGCQAMNPTKPEYLAQDCDAYGFQRGTRDHAECMLYLKAHYDNEWNQRRAVSAAMMGAGAAMIQAGKPAYTAPAVPASPFVSTHCTGQWVGSQWVSNCR